MARDCNCSCCDKRKSHRRFKRNKAYRQPAGNPVITCESGKPGICTKGRCMYVVNYPARYFKGPNEFFKDTLCCDYKCEYFTLPYRYFQASSGIKFDPYGDFFFDGADD